MSATQFRVFISSVQDEFWQIRQDLKAFLLNDAVLRRFIAEVFLFEDIPANSSSATQVYLNEVERCDIYLGIFGNSYGYENSDGISPTELEYDYAKKHHKTQLVYIWGRDDKNCHPKMKQLIKKASAELVRRRVEDWNGLNSGIYASIVEYLDSIGVLRIPPFDTAVCDNVTLNDISRKQIDWFLETACRERGFPLKANTTTRALLTHLNLMGKGNPTNAAILLFGVNPQKYHRVAETKCIHCHGTEYTRPFASQQIYTGNVFEQIEQATDFVLSKINRHVGTRSSSVTAPATYELPPDAVTEAIVNAVAHRDYNSNASVEVRLFADRLEIWNPGSLPGTLTPEILRKDHPSIPFNPLLADSLYLARYIEKAGSGTQAMILLCGEAGLPEPTFEQRHGSLVITIWRDWLTNEYITSLDLNDRQLSAMKYIKENGQITNKKYQAIASTSSATAKRDLEDLISMGIINLLGSGRGAYYVQEKKRLINGSNSS